VLLPKRRGNFYVVSMKDEGLSFSIPAVAASVTVNPPRLQNQLHAEENRPQSDTGNQV
jgi:hypothetical protein